jgi:DNA-binding response OmpR family regulator
VLLDAGVNPAAALDLLRRIKEFFPVVPVLFLANRSSEELAIAAFRFGARDYLRRPMELIWLPDRIETLLGLRGRSMEKRTRYPSGE